MPDVREDPRVSKIATVEACETFARNAEKKNEADLAQQARRRGVRQRALTHGAHSDVEREALEAVYAYERVLSARRGRNVRASRTWQMIDRLGILPSIERIVTRRDDAVGFQALVAAGLDEFAFEAVVLRNAQHFTPEAIDASRQRLSDARSSSAVG